MTDRTPLGECWLKKHGPYQPYTEDLTLSKSSVMKTASFKLLYVIGAQKAGTTWLHEMFAQNSDTVLVQDQKEIDFWNTHFAPHHKKYHRRARLKFYRAALATCFGLITSKKHDYKLRKLHLISLSGSYEDAIKSYCDFLKYGVSQQTLCADISPNYSMLEEDAILRMANLTDCQFVLVLRDPLSRAISAVNYAMMGKMADKERMSFGEHFTTLIENGDPYGNYPRLIRLLSENVPGGRWKVLFYERLFTEATRDELSQFLGVENLRWPSKQKANVSDRSGFPSDEEMHVVADHLLNIYDFCDQFFSGAVPDKWKENRASLKVLYFPAG